MLSEKQVVAVEDIAEELDARRKQRPAREVSPDQQWARSNLRRRDGRVLLDIANVLRILQRHEEFNGRFKYNETLSRVMDKGKVMFEWRISECTAQIQERFMAEVPEPVVRNALIVAANHSGTTK